MARAELTHVPSVSGYRVLDDGQRVRQIPLRGMAPGVAGTVTPPKQTLCHRRSGPEAMP